MKSAKAISTALLLAAVCLCPARAQCLDVAALSAAPGATRPADCQAGPGDRFDEQLSGMHEPLSRFAAGWVCMLNRNLLTNRGHMQISPRPDGCYAARYHEIDPRSVICLVRRTSLAKVPFFGVIKYKEMVFESVAESEAASRQGEFQVVRIINNQETFNFKNGSWN
ncbi:MAG: hypothetical protein PHV85_01945 [Desulfovibrionaceae bacterium]|nr:hypothetical protein [Desulfovibrionaceae bacterium]